MYKVFIYDKPVLIDKKSKKNGSYEQLNSVGNVADLISLLEHDEIEGVEIVCENPKKEWKLFKAYFKFIIAAGGTVFNDRKELLVIYRLGKWDLPKGKLEKGEDIPICAKREVEEECNVDGLKIIKEVSSTFHCFKTKKGKWALKRTYWYKMNTHFMGKLIPQLEEGIEKVEWVKKNQIESLKRNTYKSIIDVFDSIY
jgi:8-oxo-dGTP pyrophosphatase MutT (NUDIX family)